MSQGNSERLTPRQKAFVAEYLVDLNATQAALRAGYSKSGASVEGSRLLANPKIQDLIAKGMSKREQRTGITQDRTLTEVGHIAFADPLGAFSDDGALRPLKDIPEELRRCIAGVDVKRVDGEEASTVTKVRFWDKPKALDLMMRHLGMLKEKVEVSGPDGGALVVEVLTYKGAKE